MPIKNIDDISDEEAAEIAKAIKPIVDKIGHKGLLIMMKLGMFMAPEDFEQVSEKIYNYRKTFGYVEEVFDEFDKLM